MSKRKKFVCGNWKLNKTIGEAKALVEGILNGLEPLDSEALPTIGVAPVYTALDAVSGILKDGPVKLTAQNGYPEPSGAFTGKVSMALLKDVGCRYVIVGHSERRTLFGETDEGVNLKAKKVLETEMTPIICVGESLAQREAGKTDQVVKREVEGAFAGMSREQVASCVLAYEPIWAIGTGKTATPKQAQEVHAFIRKAVSELYDEEISSGLVIQYGGSVKPNNAKELMGQQDVDGALVGGASLKPESFVDIIRAAMD